MTSEGCDTGPSRSCRQSLSPSPGRPTGRAGAIALVSAPVDGAPLLRRHVDPDDPAASTPGLGCANGPKRIASEPIAALGRQAPAD